MKTLVPEPGRIRQVPEHFSWIDHRIIRYNRLKGCSMVSWALYLFLVIVADRNGVSYYSFASLQKRIGLTHEELQAGIDELVDHSLIAYKSSYFQVLEVGNAIH